MKKPLDKHKTMCYNKYRKGQEKQTKKTLKKVKKVLDKPFQICYNNNVNKNKTKNKES